MQLNFHFEVSVYADNGNRRIIHEAYTQLDSVNMLLGHNTDKVRYVEIHNTDTKQSAKTIRIERGDARTLQINWELNY